MPFLATALPAASEIQAQAPAGVRRPPGQASRSPRLQQQASLMTAAKGPRPPRRAAAAVAASTPAMAAASLLALLSLGSLGARAFLLPTPSSPGPISLPRPSTTTGSCPLRPAAASRGATRLAARGRRQRPASDYEEEEDEMGDEVARIVGYGEEGRPLRRNRNQILEWLRELYHKIFWFGLEGLAEDDDDYYLDEIDWLGEWSKPQDVGKGWKGDKEEEEQADRDLAAAYEKGGNGRLFRGAFPFDRQTYPPPQPPARKGAGAPRDRGGRGGVAEDEGLGGDAGDEREVVLRKVGEREETPLWRNVRPGSSGGSSGGSGGRASAAVGRRVGAGGSGGGGSGSPVQELARLEEQKQVLTVNRGVWKRRVAEALRETAGAGAGAAGGDGKKGEAAGKLAKARARLQEIDQQLEDVELEMQELRVLITAPSRAGASDGSSSGGASVPEDEEDDADEEDEDSRI